VHGADGELRGILGAHLSWTWAAQIKRELVDRVIEQHQAEALVLAADGTVLLGSPLLQGKKLDALADHLTVGSKTRGAGRYPGLGWNVVLRQPEAVAMAEFRAIHQRMLLAALALCLLLVPLLWLLARRLAAPMWDLTARLETHGTAAPVRERRNPLYREADLLGDALDRYAQRQAEDAARLRELNTTLEARVAQRTAALAASEQRLRDITDNVPALIAYFGADEHCQFANASARRIHAIAPEHLAETRLRDALGDRYGEHEAHIRLALSGQRTSFDGQADIGGRQVDFQTHFMPDVAADGRVAGFYILAYDQTALKKAERQLILMARTDPLTRLPNRLHFNEKLVEALARSRRRSQAIALLFLDVDKFKSINDSLGHAAGDEVLKIFASRLAACIRETDSAARLAGDEFVVILEDLHTLAEPQFVARKILAAVNRPFELPGGLLDVSSSIGIAYQADGRIQPEQLLAAADKALYEAKAGGRNTFRMSAM